MNTTTVPYTFESKNFSRDWLLANMFGTMTGGWIAYIVLALAVVYSVASEVILLALIALGVLLANILTGYGEYLVLKRHLKLANRWFLVSTIGAVLLALYWVLPVIIFWVDPFEKLTPYLINWLIVYIALSCLIPGFLQWLVLHRLVLRPARWIWYRILGSLVFLLGWLCAFTLLSPTLFIFMGLAGEYGLNLYIFFGSGLAIVAAGALSGKVSGDYMETLLGQPVREDADCEFSELIWKF